jgi:hypothetical protein
MLQETMLPQRLPLACVLTDALQSTRPSQSHSSPYQAVYHHFRTRTTHNHDLAQTISGGG